jgi:D-serine deaminase-like pyridoxal phosphate-dependent protein
MTMQIGSTAPRRLADLATPCLLLDRGKLTRNLAIMSAAVRRHGVALRPHMKTAKSAAVARLATAGEAGGITVSTLAEAEYFAGEGFRDILYAVGIVPAKLDRAAALSRAGTELTLVTDDPETASAIAGHARSTGAAHRVLIEVDCGEHRGGTSAEGDKLIAVARALGSACAGVMTHAGHSYSCRSIAEVEVVAETERRAAVTAAERLRGLGLAAPIVSVGSTPTALHVRSLAGVTETRPGVYMFQDLFQVQIGSGTPENMAVTGEAIVERANQEHGVVAAPTPLLFDRLKVGSLVRVAPNHVCMTAAAYDRYHVIDGDDAVSDIWHRVNGW